MAIIKCKMCGGDLIITEGSSVCECEYCGSKQTVPIADNEKKLTLFTRAGRLLRGCEFDKAAGVFETIVADFPEEAEAYWGLVLCKYGIEYVDDPGTGKKIPTCHRSSFESVEDDTNFEQACENADTIARRLYREEARQIETLRQRILEVSGKEEPYDIFISYKELDEDGERTIDSVIAQDIYKALNKEGYRVFFSRISLEGKLGIEYEPYIFAALNSAKVMIVVGTDYEYFNAVWVKNEWSRFLKLISDGQQKTLIPVYKDMDPYDMPKELKNLSAQNMGKIGAMQDLLHGVEKLISPKKAEDHSRTGTLRASVQAGGPNVTALLKRGNMALEVGDWDVAVKCFDQLLSIDADCTEAYLGIAMANANAVNRENYGLRYIAQYPALKANKNAVVAQRMDPILKEWFSELDGKGEEILRQKKEAEAKRKREEELKRQEELRQEALKRQEELERAALKRQEEERKALEEKKRWEATGKLIRSFNSVLDTGLRHTVGLKTDGTVLAVGTNNSHQCDVALWRDIVAVAAGAHHTVGLRSDGTVVAAGGIDYDYSSGGRCVVDFGQCNVTNWKDIVAICACGYRTVGLKSDGTVLAVGTNENGECDVSSWTDIIAISSGPHHTVGLKSDGTVVATGRTVEGQCEVSVWKNIIAIAATNYTTIGLERDGKVHVVGGSCNGSRDFGFHNESNCTFSSWQNIVNISAGPASLVGIDDQGNVFQYLLETYASYYFSLDDPEWRDLLTIKSKDGTHAVGLKKDGTVVSKLYVPYGVNVYEKLKSRGLDTSDWKLFDDYDHIEKERKEAREAVKIRTEKKKRSLELGREQIKTELSNLHGLFNGKRRKELGEKLAIIESELKELR